MSHSLIEKPEFLPQNRPNPNEGAQSPAATPIQLVLKRVPTIVQLLPRISRVARR
jgi:hypothetical protein